MASEEAERAPQQRPPHSPETLYLNHKPQGGGCQLLEHHLEPAPTSRSRFSVRVVNVLVVIGKKLIAALTLAGLVFFMLFAGWVLLVARLLAGVAGARGVK